MVEYRITGMDVARKILDENNGIIDVKDFLSEFDRRWESLTRKD